MGVNVLATARAIGIPITTKPKATIYKIALLGYPITPAKNLFDYDLK
jgi:hypothetical protein